MYNLHLPSKYNGHCGWNGHHGQDGHYGRDVHHGRDIHHGRGQTGQTKLIFKLDFPDNLCWIAFAILEVFRCYGHFALNDLQYPNFAFKVIIARLADLGNHEKYHRFPKERK